MEAPDDANTATRQRAPPFRSEVDQVQFECTAGLLAQPPTIDAVANDAVVAINVDIPMPTFRS
jgi:hypothetical protein